ncbi:MAG: YggT family protein [Chloroflexi bacterium]|nr:MAG: YggT family protein [Chloroflexota bacterium]
MFVVFLIAFVDTLANALGLAILVRVVLSWFPNLRIPLGVGDFAWNVSEPILGPIRRILPVAGGLDLSPFIALIAIQFLKGILLQLIAQAR